MSEENTESKKEEIPKICTFRGLKPEVFRRAHKKAKELESSGKTLLSDDWKKILSESWDEVKEEVKKVCSCVPLISEKSEEESASEGNQQDMPDEKLEPEEEPIEDEQAVEQDIDAIPKQPLAEHIETEETLEENSANIDDEIEKPAGEEEQEKPEVEQEKPTVE